jgi:hypothetical protein
MRNENAKVYALTENDNLIRKHDMGERHLWPIGLEEILVDVEFWDLR